MHENFNLKVNGDQAVRVESRVKVARPIATIADDITIGTYQQKAFWTEFPALTSEDSVPMSRAGRTSLRIPHQPDGISLSLWPNDLGNEVIPIDKENRDGSSAPEYTATTAVPFRSLIGRREPAPKPLPLRPSVAKPSIPVRQSRASAPIDGGDQLAMETVADIVQELLDCGGSAADRIREFAASFPPASEWSEIELSSSEGECPVAGRFAPTPTDYSIAIREIVSGRRKVRLRGQWHSGSIGEVSIGRSNNNVEWQLLDTIQDISA